MLYKEIDKGNMHLLETWLWDDSCSWKVLDNIKFSWQFVWCGLVMYLHVWHLQRSLRSRETPPSWKAHFCPRHCRRAAWASASPSSVETNRTSSCKWRASFQTARLRRMARWPLVSLLSLSHLIYSPLFSQIVWHWLGFHTWPEHAWMYPRLTQDSFLWGGGRCVWSWVYVYLTRKDFFQKFHNLLHYFLLCMQMGRW